MDSEARRSRLASLFLRGGVTVGIFAAIIWLLPMGEVWKAMTLVGWWRWLAVACVFGIGHVISAYKWSQLVHAAGAPHEFGLALRAHMAGLFANIWLPSIVGGDVVRAAWISRHHGVTVSAVTGLLDRALDLLALVILIACGAILTGDLANSALGSVLFPLGLFLLFCLVAALMALRYLRPGHLPAAMRPTGKKVLEIARALYARPGPALRSLLLAIFVQSAFVWLNYYIGTAIGIDVHFSVWLMAWPLAKLMALLPVSLGGLGVREAALAALLLPFAVTGTLAVAEALVWQSILMGFGFLAGAGSIMSGKRIQKSG
ncbi:MAG: flippase-like domain-containing protein [Xanthomonadales bacterium]|nr:flippase-like domain-containing protein [Xanthomonadales bacterium]